MNTSPQAPLSQALAQLLDQGTQWVQQGQQDRAADCWRRAIEIAPDCAPALNSTGAYCTARGRIDEAQGCWNGRSSTRPAWRSPTRISRASIPSVATPTRPCRRSIWRSARSRPRGARTWRGRACWSPSGGSARLQSTGQCAGLHAGGRAPVAPSSSTDPAGQQLRPRQSGAVAHVPAGPPERPDRATGPPRAGALQPLPRHRHRAAQFRHRAPADAAVPPLARDPVLPSRGLRLDLEG